ncbi:hypothetical protein [Legionella maioricensis]|uniref:Uncharacterized protein n=1 Tax=Legionella maioricensis TaxID=2896528 RepID=A0A9X2D1T5_9GAMM|nr:hypothetical protein [Legionella maioricensis]MCL9684633.1 hypothetical protein [Legionella maioricensis]MCL9687413.1 hypothetical protein [Legionella maioricensis]
MADIFKALTKLKAELDHINGRTLAESREDLNNTSKSAQLFINPDLLPEFINPDLLHEGVIKGVTDSDAQRDYADHVLQAVWNIAHHASRGYTVALWNRNTITEAFAYLDRTRVPKIIDEKTYAVGKALQAFLQEALTQEALNNVPEVGGARNLVKNTLEGMQTILNQRLHVYEIHQPKKVSDTVNHLKITMERGSEWDKALRAFERRVDPNPYWKFIPQELDSNYHALEEKLHILDEYDDFFAREAEEFREYSKQWKDNGLAENLPDTVTSSYYIRALAESASHQKIVEELAKVYNSSNYKTWSENAGRLFTITYEATEGKIERIEIQAKEIVAMQRQMLVNRIEDSKSLAVFERNLQEAVDTPETIPSLMENSEIPASEDIEFYNNLNKNLESHRVSLSKSKLSLEKKIRNFETDNPLPPIKEAEHKSAFEAVRTKAKQQLTSEVEAIEQQITVVNSLLAKVKTKVTYLGDELAKQSEDGRKNKLEEVGTRIREAFRQLHEKSHPKRVEAEVQSHRFLEGYTPAVAAIEKEYAPQISALDETISTTHSQISSKEHSLGAINQQNIERKNLLKTSRAELEQFKEILEKESGIYIPSTKIPKELLIKYLECNEKIAEFIGEMYQTEQASNYFYGFNPTNIYNKYRHHASILGPSDFDLDIGAIIDYISEKIELIDQEMQIDVTSDLSAPSPSKNYLLGKGNLWELQKEYQKIRQEKIALELQSKKDEETQQKMTATMTTKLNEWNEAKAAKEETAAFATLEEKMNTQDHLQAMVALNAYELEFKLADIEKEQKGLDDIIRALDTMDDKESLKYLEGMRDKIALIDVDKMMESKPDHRVYSGTELQRHIHDSLSALQKSLIKLRSEDQATIDKSEVFKSKLGALEVEFEELKAKSARLDSSLEKIREAHVEKMKILNEKKDTLIALNQFTEIEDALRTKYIDVINDTAIRPDNREAREILIEEMEQFKETNFGPLKDFKVHPNESVNEKHQSALQAAHKLEDYLVKLKLDRVEEDTDSFIKRFSEIKGFSVKNRSERNALLDDIEKLKIREGDFLAKLADSDSEEIQQKLRAISQNMEQMDGIKSQLTPSAVSRLTFFGAKGVMENEVTAETELAMDSIRKSYFEPEVGIFTQYLQERAQQFWLKDLFRSLAAFTLGCFGYKTDAQEREEYLKGLEIVFNRYHNESKGALVLAEIEKGQKLFSPRAKAGEDGYNDSLHSKLESLKESLTPIYAKGIEPENKLELSQ